MEVEFAIDFDIAKYVGATATNKRK